MTEPVVWKSSKERLADEIERQHKAHRDKAAAAPPPTDVELAALTKRHADVVRDVERTNNLASVGAKLPVAAKIALGEPRVFNPKIHAEDLAANYQGDPLAALAFIHRASQLITDHRKPGEVRAVYLRGLADIIAWGGAHKDGKTEISFDRIAERMPCCRETARKAVRWFERWRLMDTSNVLARVGRNLWRAANAYFPLLVAPPETPFETPAGASPEAPALDADVAPALAPLARAAETLSRLAGRFRSLVSRDWGLNATPAKFRRGRPEADPQPA